MRRGRPCRGHEVDTMRVVELRDRRWNRFAIRSSNSEEPLRSADTYAVKPESKPKTINGAIVCPAQTGQSDCCATCAICWSTDKAVAFLLH